MHCSNNSHPCDWVRPAPEHCEKKKIAYSDFFNVEFNRETEVEREEVEKKDKLKNLQWE